MGATCNSSLLFPTASQLDISCSITVESSHLHKVRDRTLTEDPSEGQSPVANH